MSHREHSASERDGQTDLKKITQPGYPDQVTLTSSTPIRQLVVWSNGRRFERPDEATVPVTDHGLVAVSYTHLTLPTTPYV